VSPDWPDHAPSRRPLFFPILAAGFPGGFLSPKTKNNPRNVSSEVLQGAVGSCASRERSVPAAKSDGIAHRSGSPRVLCSGASAHIHDPVDSDKAFATQRTVCRCYIAPSYCVCMSTALQPPTPALVGDTHRAVGRVVQEPRKAEPPLSLEASKRNSLPASNSFCLPMGDGRLRQATPLLPFLT
jgi:hypothetical protein